MLRIAGWTVGLLAVGAFCALTGLGLAFAVAYPKLPEVSDLLDYRPNLPLRIFSAEGTLIGEFGERRNLTPLKDIPKVMKDAVLAIEDARDDNDLLQLGLGESR